MLTPLITKGTVYFIWDMQKNAFKLQMNITYSSRSMELEGWHEPHSEHKQTFIDREKNNSKCCEN